MIVFLLLVIVILLYFMSRCLQILNKAPIGICVINRKNRKVLYYSEVRNIQVDSFLEKVLDVNNANNDIDFNFKPSKNITIKKWDTPPISVTLKVYYKLQRSIAIFYFWEVPKVKIPTPKNPYKIFKIFFEKYPTPCIVTNSKKEIVYANNLFKSISGFTHNQLIGKTGFELGFWNDIKDRQSFLNDLKTTGKSTIEASFNLKEGRKKGLLIASVIVVENIQYTIINIIDISNILSKISKYDLIVESIHLGIMLYSNFKLEYINSYGNIHYNKQGKVLEIGDSITYIASKVDADNYMKVLDTKETITYISEKDNMFYENIMLNSGNKIIHIIKDCTDMIINQKDAIKDKNLMDIILSNFPYNFYIVDKKNVIYSNEKTKLNISDIQKPGKITHNNKTFEIRHVKYQNYVVIYAQDITDLEYYNIVEKTFKENLISQHKQEITLIVFKGLLHLLNEYLSKIIVTAHKCQCNSGDKINEHVNSIVSTLTEISEISKPSNVTLEKTSSLIDKGIVLSKHTNFEKIYYSLDFLEVNPNELIQVFIHLFKNAHQIKPKNKITIKTSVFIVKEDRLGNLANYNKIPPGRYTKISVIDECDGISKIENIFDIFYTSKNNTENKGLGLYYSSEVIRKHGGYIIVYNTDIGATFDIYLPSIEPNENAEILVIDDMIAKDITELLESINYSVIYAETGKKGLSLLSITQSIKVVFLDIVLPDMHCLKMFEELRKINPDIKIVLITGHLFEETEPILNVNHDGLLLKPIKKDTLVKTLTELMEIHGTIKI